MSRTALSALLIAASATAAALAQLPSPINPHLERSSVPGACRACHRGHGVSRTPMLTATANEVCLACHDSQARAAEAVARGWLAPGARPPLLGGLLVQPFTHPLTADATSREQTGAITCTSCHSPHRGAREPHLGSVPGRKKVSPRDPSRFEHELCESCHGGAGVRTESLLDLSRLFDPNSRSFHPVHATTAERAPSIVADLAGREINCTDCHANSDAQGPRGPHGSAVAALLVANYVTVDGSDERRETYGLCYGCHQREKVLASTVFPEHARHVVDEKASCATCHGAHGSISNRALIRFGEETTLGGVGPSLAAGRLEFVSDAQGSGLCYLTCHGVDHGPKGYGGDVRPLGSHDVEALRGQLQPVAPGEGLLAPAVPELPRPEREAAPPPL